MEDLEIDFDELLKEIEEGKTIEKEQKENTSIISVLATLTKPNPVIDNFIDFFINNKESIEETIDFIEKVNSLSEEEKKELATRLEEEHSSVLKGNNEYDRAYKTCDTVPTMTKIINSSEADLEAFKKTEAFSMLTAPYSKALFTGKETEKVVPVNNYKTKETAEVLLRILPAEVTSSEYIKIENPLDEYDREIVNAIHTMWENGTRRFTPQNVYEYMTGSKTPVRKKLDEISSRIMKLDSTKVDIFLADLFKKVYPNLKVPEKKQVILESRIINVDRIRWVDEYNKQTIQEGFVFLKEPTLTTVCKMCNYQITTVPTKMLSSPSRKVSNTDTSVVLTNYLAQRIYTMKNEPKISRDILFDTIFKDNNMLEKSRTEINRIRTVIFSILDSWVEDRIIKKYETNSKGKKRYHSITISL